jgi:hypothetical protein
MTILQGLIASITRVAPAGPPPFTPIDSGMSLGLDWTVEIIAQLTPTQFWATIWGNEVWNEGKGHLAYLGNENFLVVGAPNAANEYSLSQNFSTKAYWAFTHSNGAGINVYRNGVLLIPGNPAYVQPTSVAPNTLLWGARHSNDGTGTNDPIGSGTYFYTNIFNEEKTESFIQSQYNSFQGSYGI